jgi:16S rRNA (cytosine967-C5)-methyltransferase
MRHEWGDEGIAALAAMDVPQEVPERPDGYRQGRASAWVAAEAAGDGLLVDLCAAPGGKATAVAAGSVVAVEPVADRVATLAATVHRLGQAHRISVVRADGTAPPLRAGVAGTVLVDAPCSNLGALGRRPEVRWRVRPGDVAPLAELQGHLLDAGAELVAPGGLLVHAVCTLTAEETTGVAGGFLDRHPGWSPEPLRLDVWRPHGTGGIVLPQDHGTDGMTCFRFRKP